MSTPRTWFRFAIRVDPDWLRIAPATRGLWLQLCCEATRRGDGGVCGFRTWDARDWDRAVAATPEEIQAVVDAGLARWHGDELRVEGYDLDGERLMKHAIASGKKGGRPPKGTRKAPSKGPFQGPHKAPLEGSETKDRTGQDLTEQNRTTPPARRRARRGETLPGVEVDLRVQPAIQAWCEAFKASTGFEATKSQIGQLGATVRRLPPDRTAEVIVEAIRGHWANPKRFRKHDSPAALLSGDLAPLPSPSPSGSRSFVEIMRDEERKAAARAAQPKSSEGL